MDVAQNVAARYGLELILVRAVPVIPKLPPDESMLDEGDYERALIRNSEQRLEELASTASEEGLKVRMAVELPNDAATEGLRIAEQERAELIVITCRATSAAD